MLCNARYFNFLISTVYLIKYFLFIPLNDPLPNCDYFHFTSEETKVKRR